MFYFGYAVATGLAVTAVASGGIDFKRIKAGRYSNKGREFDITGIVLGGVFIILFLPVWLLEVIFPY